MKEVEKIWMTQETSYHLVVIGHGPNVFPVLRTHFSDQFDPSPGLVRICVFDTTIRSGVDLMNIVSLKCFTR